MEQSQRLAMVSVLLLLMGLCISVGFNQGLLLVLLFGGAAELLCRFSPPVRC